MAIIGQTFVDLIDIYKMEDSRRNVVPVIEMLHQQNPILQDAIAVQCNNGTKHLHSVRTGLPQVTWGKMYKGIPQGKSTRAQVEDTTGFVEGLSSVDQRVLDISANPAAVRLSEASAYLESMNQEIAEKLFYSDVASDPEQFMGLAPRFNDMSAPNGNQIVDGGGTGSDNTSIWIVTWGDNACQMLYPTGTAAGVSRQDMGRQRVNDADGNPYFVEEELFRWHTGLAVKDWRYVVRIANIDVSKLQDGTTNPFTLLRKAYYRWHGRKMNAGRAAIYCNAEVAEALDAASTNAQTTDNRVRLRPMEIEGKEVQGYRGIPIRECDAILNTEALVS